MLYVVKYLSTLTRNSKYINTSTTIITKAYYCEKKNMLPILEETLKEGKSAKSCEEIENVTFANEEEILQTVITEKEKDANVRSRLSKECNKLLEKKIALTSSGLNLHLENKGAHKTSWEDYTFDKTIDRLKKHTLAPVVNAKEASGKTLQSVCSGNGPTVNLPNRIVRGEPGKVLFAFIPEEWFHFFIPKTGVSGFGTFLFTFGIYLVSKEYFVLEHNYYNGLGMVILWWGAIKYVGPPLAKYLDKEIDEYEKSWQHGRDEIRKVLNEQIDDEKLLQFQADGQFLLLDAKRENVHLQLEEEFRLRQMMVYKTVVGHLDYHVAIAEVYRKIFHKNLVDYVTREVRKAITPEMEQKMFDISIDGLLLELQKDENKK